MLTKQARPEESNTLYAQGGIIYRGKVDSPAQLAADIIAAGDGLCNPAAVDLLAREGPRLVDEVLIRDARVRVRSRRRRDRSPRPHGGGRALDRAHRPSRRRHRAVDRRGDAGGRRARTRHRAAHRPDGHRPADAVAPFAQPARRLRRRRPASGPTSSTRRPGGSSTIMARETILATGGLGRIFLHTSNPAGRVRRRRGHGLPGRCALHQHAVRAVPPDDAVSWATSGS